MKVIKKIKIGLLLMLSMMIVEMGTIALSNIEVKAAQEKENNDTFYTANVIAVNSSTTGYLSGRDDEDYYKFTLNERGKIRIKFYHDFNKNYNCWGITIYQYKNGSYQELVYRTTASDEPTLPFPDLGLNAGDYYIKVNRNWNEPQNINYRIEMNFSKTNSFETEFNDTFQQANTLGQQSSISGNLRNGNDEDCYKIVTSQKGKLDIKFSHDYSKGDNRCWGITVYKYVDNSYLELMYFDTNTESNTLNLYTLGVDRGIYYIKINNNWNNPQDVNYTIKTTFTKTSHFETEFNESYYQTNTFELGKSISGTLRKKDDIDMYKINLKSSGGVKFVFGFKNDNGSNFWNVELIRYKNGNYEQVIAIQPRSGDGNCNIYQGTLPKGTYFIKVSHSWNEPQGIIYRISANYYVDKVENVKGYAKKGKIKVAWKKESSISGYEIQYARNRKFTKGKKTIKVDSKSRGRTIKRLKRKKTYYVRIRAYKNISGKKINGSWSRKIKVKVK